ncbi:PEP-CTERM sorting domain-containing protein [Schlegelella aquatica]|uniref:PEP-CTERM sorting domain-containing protein n=1 Tax=Caldimonas aquatica TaxID=376175 RepID=UPI003751DFE1
MRRSLLATAAAAVLAASASTASAASYSYSFTQLLDGTTIAPVASLTIEDVAGGARFTLVGEFDEWGSSAFLGGLEFNGPEGTVDGLSGNAMRMEPTYGSHTNASYTFTWEVRFPVSNEPGSDRFLNGDSASWTIFGDGIHAGSFAGTALVHLQGLGPNGEDSLKVTTMIPEPSTYALLLAGLAGTGLWVRRRQRLSE